MAWNKTGEASTDQLLLSIETRTNLAGADQASLRSLDIVSISTRRLPQASRGDCFQIPCLALEMMIFKRKECCLPRLMFGATSRAKQNVLVRGASWLVRFSRGHRLSDSIRRSTIGGRTCAEHIQTLIHILRLVRKSQLQPACSRRDTLGTFPGAQCVSVRRLSVPHKCYRYCGCERQR